jgi:ankyrin repeat protein
VLTALQLTLFLQLAHNLRGEQVASQLLEAKADVRAKARDGKTAVDAAVSQGRCEFPSHVCDWCSPRAHSL